MPRKEFPSIKAVRDYAARQGMLPVWQTTTRFTTYQRRLSPDQYEIVDVRSPKGIRRAMLVPKATLKAEWESLRDALGLKPASKPTKTPPTD